MSDPELQREMKIAFGGLMLMAAVFMLFMGVYGALNDLSRSGRPDLINRGILGGPIFLYFAMSIFFGPGDKPDEKDLTRWQWMSLHWRLMLGCIAFEVICLTVWVSYLHHHGFSHVS